MKLVTIDSSLPQVAKMANFAADGYFLCKGYTYCLPYYVTFHFYSMVTQQLQDSVRFEAMFFLTC